MLYQTDILGCNSAFNEKKALRYILQVADALKMLF